MSSLKQSIGNKKHASKDDVCFLISTTITKDELLQEIKTDVERQVFCDRLSVGQKEFAVSMQNNLKPEMTIVMDHDEYDYESKLRYRDKSYSIYRTFVRDDGDIELYCEVRVGGHSNNRHS